MILIIQIIGHLIADFYLQSAKMAEGKREKFITLLLHSGIYLLISAAVSFLLINPWNALFSTLIFAVSHFLIDFARTKADVKFQSKSAHFLSFLLDQILHISIIISTCLIFDLNQKGNMIFDFLVSKEHSDTIVSYCLLFVIILEPAAVFVKKMFAFLFDEKTEESSGNNAGSMIGKLERGITAVLLLCNQYGVIGLVLTAKSIARFKQLEDKDFAEKYLIGTLTSLAISLVVTLAIKVILL